MRGEKKEGDREIGENPQRKTTADRERAEAAAGSKKERKEECVATAVYHV